MLKLNLSQPKTSNANSLIVMSLEIVTTLRDLVATPSVNPMGRSVSGPEYYEYRLTDYLERLFARLEIPTWRQPIAEKRDNLLRAIDW